MSAHPRLQCKPICASTSTLLAPMRDQGEHNYVRAVAKPGPHRGVWNSVALSVSKEILLREALPDTLTFWCAGGADVGH